MFFVIIIDCASFSLTRKIHVAMREARERSVSTSSSKRTAVFEFASADMCEIFVRDVISAIFERVEVNGEGEICLNVEKGVEGPFYPRILLGKLPGGALFFNESSPLNHGYIEYIYGGNETTV